MTGNTLTERNLRSILECVLAGDERAEFKKWLDEALEGMSYEKM